MLLCPGFRPAFPSPSLPVLECVQPDFIGTERETGTQAAMRERLHVAWQAEQDAKEVEDVWKAVQNGFKKRGGQGFMDDVSAGAEGCGVGLGVGWCLWARRGVGWGWGWESADC